MLSKKVNQYDLEGNFIKSYPSTKEIERQLGIQTTLISQCCRGLLKTSGGYKWKYADEELQKWNNYDKIYLHLKKAKCFWLVGGKDLTTFRR